MKKICEKCGADLMSQRGFTPDLDSFECNKCGHVNGNTELAKKGKKKQSFARRHLKQIIMIIFVIAVIVIVVSAVSSGVNTIKSLQRVGISSAECIDNDCLEVKTMFEERNFTDITLKPMNDLKYENLDKENTVGKVTIKDKEKFRKGKIVRNDSPVTIYYHSGKIVKAPLASRNIDNMNVNTVKKKFEKAGFVNIKYDPVYGIWGKEGAVLSMTIDGQKKWKENDKFTVKDEVVIKYRTRN